MTPTVPGPATFLRDGRAADLVALYESNGYGRIDPPVLQPADAILDLAGEDLRRRLFMTTDAAGREFCLRYDLTVPVARAHLAARADGEPAAYAYLGPVFRFRGSAPAEFLQAGVESFGRTDIAAADAEILGLAVDTTAHYGLADPYVKMGDVGLFTAFVGALDMAPAVRRRLLRDFGRPGEITADVAPPAGATANDYRGVLAALEGADPKAARALVGDLLSIAGVSTVGGRTVGEIAERFLDRATHGGAAALAAEQRDLIARFLALAGDPDEIAAGVRALAAEARLDLGAVLDGFEERTGFLAARGLDVRRIGFATAFGRGLDYYTGLVFELHDPTGAVQGQLVAGGRYDRLLGMLGRGRDVPAVGFAAWTDRLSAVAEARP